MLDRLKKKILKPQSKVEFVSLLPEVTEIMPIIPASKQQYNWVKKAYENYKNSDYKGKNSNIYGKATLKESEELREEGIELTTIPWIDNKKEN